jgi:stage II sporulation protein D
MAFKEEKTAKGIAYLKKAKELDPSITSVYKQLALSFYKTDDYAASFKEASKYLGMVGFDVQVERVHDLAKERLGEDFFKEQQAKLKKDRRAKTLSVASYVADRDVPLVRVCIAEGIGSFQFKSTDDASLKAGGLTTALKKDVVYRLSVDSVGKTLRLSDADDKTVRKDIKAPLRLVSGSATSLFGIFGITYAEGSYWSGTLDNFFRRDFEVRIEGGRITLINIVNIEEYLYGVLPSEVSSAWPAHALYAQAVVARSKALKGLGTYQRRGFDFYNTVAYQVYLGASQETEAAGKAVDKTRGLIITLEGKLFDVYYSSNCGGHTRDSGLFEGVLDSEIRVNSDFPLTPLGLYRWVAGTPPVFCRTRRQEKSRFRWQRLYTKDELEKIVSASLGLEAIEGFAAKRNISGHIDALQIITASGRQSLSAEHRVRQALDDMRSSCFRIEAQYGPDAEPVGYIFWGAGFGHAKGLCQYGAKGMAERGYSYRHILGHYFPKAKLRKAY